MNKTQINEYLEQLETFEKTQFDLAVKLNHLLLKCYEQIENEPLEKIVEVLPSLAKLRNTSLLIGQKSSRSHKKIKKLCENYEYRQLKLDLKGVK
jgi:hypothetical protein